MKKRIISATEYWTKIYPICQKTGKHKFRTNEFGVTWCVRCGALGTIGDPVQDYDAYKIIPDKEYQKVIAFDWDNTMVIDNWPYLGEPIPKAFEILRKLQAKGHKLILLTMREHEPWGDCPDVLQPVLDKLEEEGIKLYGINEFPESDNKFFKSNKVYCDLQFDDHGAMIPLVKPEGHEPYVDWDKIEPWLFEEGYI